MNPYSCSRILISCVVIYEIINNITTKEELLQINECISPYSRNLMCLSCRDDG